MEILIQCALILMNRLCTGLTGHWIGPFELGQVSPKHFPIITWKYYLFDRSPGKEAQWAISTVSHETWIAENCCFTLIIEFAVPPCVFICICVANQLLIK